MAAWIETNAVFGATGSAGGFDPATKLVDAPTEGTIRALTWTLVRDAIEAVYNAGGNPSVLMSVPTTVKAINSFLFSDEGDPFRADPVANVTGTTPASQTAQGYISVVLSDFGISLSLVDNRLQQLYNTATASDVFLFDASFLAISTMGGFRQDLLAKTGHAENRLLSVNWMTKVFREDGQAMIADVDISAAVVA